MVVTMAPELVSGQEIRSVQGDPSLIVIIRAVNGVRAQAAPACPVSSRDLEQGWSEVLNYLSFPRGCPMIRVQRQVVCTWGFFLLVGSSFAVACGPHDTLAKGVIWGLAVGQKGQGIRPKTPPAAKISLLSVAVEGPEEVQRGQDITYTLTVTNKGRKPIAGGVLQSTIPPGLTPKSETQGTTLKWTLGNLEPGQSQKFTYALGTLAGGDFESEATVFSANGRLCQKRAFRTKVIGPSLRVAIESQRIAFQKRFVTFKVSVSNAGNETARDIDVAVSLPDSLDYVESLPKGAYSLKKGGMPAGVAWYLDQVEPSKSSEFLVTLRTRDIGRGTLTAKLRPRSPASHPPIPLEASSELQVVGVPAMHLSTYDTEDPVIVGGHTTYVIEVRNEGSGPCTNIGMTSRIPEPMEFLKAEGPTPFIQKGGQVIFDGMPILMPRGKLIYKVTFKAVREGSALHRATLQYDQFDKPIVQEEATTCVR